jgi:hypothetical protein
MRRIASTHLYSARAAASACLLDNAHFLRKPIHSKTWSLCILLKRLITQEIGKV